MKRPFDINEAIRLVREAVKPFPKAALFELHDEGYSSVFEILCAAIVSIRTLDEVTLPAARRLFAVARTPAAVSRLTVEDIDQLIGTCTFHQPKAGQIHAIAKQVVAKHGGELPCDRDVMLSFRGVGPKCAHLALGIACGQARISIDVHVQRVTNRWGYIEAPTPEKTRTALEAVLPRRYWVEINELLVPFGKHVCTGRLPKCSTCPLQDTCRQVGVTQHR